MTDNTSGSSSSSAASPLAQVGKWFRSKRGGGSWRGKSGNGAGGAGAASVSDSSSSSSSSPMKSLDRLSKKRTRRLSVRMAGRSYTRLNIHLDTESEPRLVEFGVDATISDVTHSLTHQLGITAFSDHFTVALVPLKRSVAPPLLFHPDTLARELNLQLAEIDQRNGNGDGSSGGDGSADDGWCAHLRMAYRPDDLEDLAVNDDPALTYLYEQLRRDFYACGYLGVQEDKGGYQKLNETLIVHLCALHVRQYILDSRPDLAQGGAVLKEKHVVVLEREPLGLSPFVPEEIRNLFTAKALRKALVAGLKLLERGSATAARLEYLRRALAANRELGLEAVPVRVAIHEDAAAESLHLVVDAEEITCRMPTEQGGGEVVVCNVAELSSAMRGNNTSSPSVTAAAGSGSESESGSGSRSSITVYFMGPSGASKQLQIYCDSASDLEKCAGLLEGYFQLQYPDRTLFSQRRRSVSESIDNHVTVFGSTTGSIVTATEAIESGQATDVNVGTHGSGGGSGGSIAENSLDGGVTVEESGIKGVRSPSHGVINADLTREQLKITATLGSGQFGIVFRGELTVPGRGTLPCAIKSINSDEEMDRDAFVAEAMLMKDLRHKYIVNLLGVVNGPSPLIVMELCPYGELRQYLIELPQDEHDTLTCVRYSWQIATGMSFLASLNYVHRDLAARNVLVLTTDHVKLADFGMARHVKADGYSAQGGARVPVKWMAPEAIAFGRHTTASDVWMFAVCCWEIMSYGIKPFVDVKNQDYLALIEGGTRLEQPAECPMPLYALLRACWTADERLRPTFDEICERLQDIISPPRNAGARPRSSSARTGARERRGSFGRARRSAAAQTISGRSSPNPFSTAAAAAGSGGGFTAATSLSSGTATPSESRSRSNSSNPFSPSVADIVSTPTGSGGKGEQNMARSRPRGNSGPLPGFDPFNLGSLSSGLPSPWASPAADSTEETVDSTAATTNNGSSSDDLGSSEQPMSPSALSQAAWEIFSASPGNIRSRSRSAPSSPLPQRRITNSGIRINVQDDDAPIPPLIYASQVSSRRGSMSNILEESEPHSSAAAAAAAAAASSAAAAAAGATVIAAAALLTKEAKTDGGEASELGSAAVASLQGTSHIYVPPAAVDTAVPEEAAIPQRGIYHLDDAVVLADVQLAETCSDPANETPSAVNALADSPPPVTADAIAAAGLAANSIHLASSMTRKRPDVAPAVVGIIKSSLHESVRAVLRHVADLKHVEADALGEAYMPVATQVFSSLTAVADAIDMLRPGLHHQIQKISVHNAVLQLAPSYRVFAEALRALPVGTHDGNGDEASDSLAARRHNLISCASQLGVCCTSLSDAIGRHEHD